jgi:hypothetical protein
MDVARDGGYGGRVAAVGGSSSARGSLTDDEDGVGSERDSSATDQRGGMGGEPGDDQLFVPTDVAIMRNSEGSDGVDLVALTLRDGDSGPQIFASVRNDGERSACNGNFSAQIFDRSEVSLANVIGNLYATRLYRPSDGSGTPISCLDPGEIGMAGLTDIPSNVIVEDVGFLVYHLNYWAMDILPFEVVPIDSVVLDQVERSSDFTFTGRLTNGLDVAIEQAGVTIFPVNALGRPLGMTLSTLMVGLLPGDSFRFESYAVDDPGVDQFAYPTGSIVF